MTNRMLPLLIFTLLTMCTPSTVLVAVEEPVASETCCAICLKSLEENSYLSPCGHMFDRACMQSWYKIKKSCPTCKTPISRKIAAAPHQHELNLLLIDAIEKGCLFGVRRLLEQGANPSKPIGNAWPLLRACCSKHPQTNDIVDALIKKNEALVTQKNYYGNTPLHMACRHNPNNTALLKRLIEAGADINSTNKDNETPLHYARHSVEAIQVLLSHNAQVDTYSNATRKRLTKNRQRTVLLEICTQPGYTPKEQTEAANIVRMLIANGANPEALDEHGRAALQIAKSRRHDGRQVTQVLRHTLHAQRADN